MRKEIQLTIIYFLLSSISLGQLSANDIMISHYSPRYNAASDEYIVLFNNTDSSIDINGYEIAYATSAGSVSTRKQFTTSTIIPSRKYYLLSSNATVTVGSVSDQAADATYTAFAADAGQIAFRKTSDQTVIYALASGTITSYAFGLSTTHTTTTSSSSQGAFELSSTGNTYTRSGDNNADYTLVASASISSVPNSGSSPLPVELTSFTADVEKNKVKLNWSTATEINNYGFEILRSTKIENWSRAGFVNGYGNSNSQKNYTFVDEPTGGREFKYKLKQIDFDGSFDYSNELFVTLAEIYTFKLNQNYPNPFNPKTVISYQLPISGVVNIKVYDILGREISTLINEFQESGFYKIDFDGSNLSSGTYIYKLKTNSYIEIKKFVLLK